MPSQNSAQELFFLMVNKVSHPAVGASNSYYEFTGPFTLETWIFPTAENNYGRYIISKQGSLSGSGYSLKCRNAQNEPKIVLRINDEELDSKSLNSRKPMELYRGTDNSNRASEIFIALCM